MKVKFSAYARSGNARFYKVIEVPDGTSKRELDIMWNEWVLSQFVGSTIEEVDP